MHLYEKTIESKKVYDGLVFSVYKDKALLENGKIADREKIVHGGATAVIPIDEAGNIYLVKQYRYGVSRVMLEIPAGKFDKNESSLECVKRELKEETGALSGDIQKLCTTVLSPAYLTETIDIFIAKNLKFENQSPDPDEFLDIIKIPLEKAYQMVLSGEIFDAKTQIAIMWVNNNF